MDAAVVFRGEVLYFADADGGIDRGTEYDMVAYTGSQTEAYRHAGRVCGAGGQDEGG